MKTFIGTSIMPKGRFLHERLNESSQLLANYMAKKDKIKEQMKGMLYSNPEYLVLKKKLNSITKGTIELRIKFIPFEIERIKSTKNNSETRKKRIEAYEKAITIHNDKVLKESERIQKDLEEKYKLYSSFVSTIHCYK